MGILEGGPIRSGDGNRSPDRCGRAGQGQAGGFGVCDVLNNGGKYTDEVIPSVENHPWKPGLWLWTRE